MLFVHFLLFLICLFAGNLHPRSVEAQELQIIWSDPINLSQSLESSSHPDIIADDYGNVHVFWSEEIGGDIIGVDEQIRSGNTILYTRWDGNRWLPPNDLFFVPNESTAEYISSFLDSENNIHLVWTGQNNLYYSVAPSEKAELATAWSIPVVLTDNIARTRYESDVVVDKDGAIHVVFATRDEDAGIYHLQSKDGGITWSEGGEISTVLQPIEESFSNVRLIVDGEGRLHTVWQTNDELGYGRGIYYSRSVDSGQSWSEPWQIKYDDFSEGPFVAWPYLMANGRDEIHLIYTTGTNQNRSYRVSNDGGATWGEERIILGNMEGVNGYVVIVADGLGRLHLIVNMRAKESQAVGIYYARQDDSTWSAAVPIATSEPYGPSAHYTAAAVRLGNEIHVVWNQLRGAEIWYMRGQLMDVSPTPVKEILQRPDSIVAPANEELEITDKGGGDAISNETTRLPERLRSTEPVPNQEWIPLIAGIAGVSLLILIVVLRRRVRA